MKHSLLVFLCLFVALTAGAQLKEKASYKKVAQDFKSYYNKEDYESLYQLISSDFQKRMSAATFKAQLKVLKFYVDEIKTFKFVPLKDTAAYKFDLGDGNFLAISLKPDLKINQLALERPKELKKEAISNNPATDNTALYKGSKNNIVATKNDPLTNSSSGLANGDTRIVPLNEFKNLVLPKDNGMVSGKIMVRAKIDRKGKIITAIAGAKGTTLADTELYRACEKALLKASFEPATGGPEFRTVFVPFTFKIK